MKEFTNSVEICADAFFDPSAQTTYLGIYMYFFQRAHPRMIEQTQTIVAMIPKNAAKLPVPSNGTVTFIPKTPLMRLRGTKTDARNVILLRTRFVSVPWDMLLIERVAR